MQFAVRVHTENFETVLNQKLGRAFARMGSVARRDIDLVMERAKFYSPVASGQMRDNMMVFDDSAGPDERLISFGMGMGRDGHEVKFEKDESVVHTTVEEHILTDEEGNIRHCAEGLVTLEELQANPNAISRPLTSAMVDVWGESMIPTNVNEFVAGRENHVEIEPLIPRVESSELVRHLEEAVRESIVG